MKLIAQSLGLTLGALVMLLPAPARAEKLRDLCDIVGARENQLVGYGVVTGLNGTGDDIMAPYAAQSIKSLLRRLGVQIDSRQVRLRNVAAVIVTATLPPFSRSGSRIDVTVSSIGNAKSLRGGVLVQTPVRGADRRTYAVAQGPLVVGGFSASGMNGSSVSENVTSTARIPSGGLVEREVPTRFDKDGKVTLSLRSPDFALAARIVDAVNQKLGKGAASAVDGGAVEVKPKAKTSKGKDGKSKVSNNDLVALVAALGDIEVEPVAKARVIINERTGTIVAGGDVRLSPVAIAQGGITIAIKEQQQVSQPGMLAQGETRTAQDSTVETTEQAPPALTFLAGATSLADVAQALSTFGVTPRELASILQALQAAGALRAEVIVQ